MQLAVRHSFAAAPDQVYALSTDVDFLARVCRDLGGRDETIAVTPTAEGAVSQVSVVVETPGPMAALAGASLTVGQEMTWGAACPDGSRDGRLFIKVAGMPVVVDAVARLAPTASGSQIAYSGTVTVDVPFVGALMEKAAAPFILETLSIQERSAADWLASH